ncbi:MAG: Vitamin B12 dependent methionine synthase activation subunit [Oscillospiraceae bacterium]|nr:Vitamin B12 dependent methionine synthase activation subunit [Oscillospiraceae bacterium]
MVLIKSYSAPPINEREVFRYAGGKDVAAVRELFEGCKTEIAESLSYKVCYLPLDVRVTDDFCDFGAFGVTSKHLARNLEGCVKAVLFAATVGVGIDRLIAKYSVQSPAKALLFDAIGTERIETLCDLFCRDIEREYQMSAKPRFSPGYGDLDISVQTELFSVLNCRKHIGLSISDSLMMSPSKSVTAIVGLCETACKKPSRKCEACGKTDCAFRGAL